MKGYAGVGKSTVTGKLIGSLKAQYRKVGVAAPTHKAVKVLKKYGDKGVDYRTVASWLAIKEHKNERTGEVTFIVDPSKIGEEPIRSVDILLLDETSMLSKDNFNRLVPWIKNHGLKVVFIGDPFQIPPVGEKDSMPFLYGEKWGALIVTLTTIHRQKHGNPILGYATYLRDNGKLANVETPPTSLLEDGSGIQVISSEDYTQEQQILEKYFGDARFKEDADFMKVVAYTNKSVDDYNIRVREILYRNAENFCAIMPGEYLIIDQPYTLGNNSILTVNEELKVLSTQVDRMPFNYVTATGYPDIKTFKIYKVQAEYFTNGIRKVAVLPVIHEESKTDFAEFLDELVNIAKNSNGKYWRQYFTAKDNRVAWVKYNYAITAHKSQGSTYEHCMVLKWSIDTLLKWNTEEKTIERNRILYTANTRTRHTLFLEV